MTKNQKLLIEALDLYHEEEDAEVKKVLEDLVNQKFTQAFEER